MTWVDDEAKRLDTERKKRRDELGMKAFYKFEQGENPLEFNASVPPKPLEGGKYGDQVALEVKVNGVEYIVATKPTGVLYELIINQLKKGKTKMTIIRMGESKNTRWSVK